MHHALAFARDCQVSSGSSMCSNKSRRDLCPSQRGLEQDEKALEGQFPCRCRCCCAGSPRHRYHIQSTLSEGIRTYNLKRAAHLANCRACLRDVAQHSIGRHARCGKNSSLWDRARPALVRATKSRPMPFQMSLHQHAQRSWEPRFFEAKQPVDRPALAGLTATAEPGCCFCELRPVPFPLELDWRYQSVTFSRQYLGSRSGGGFGCGAWPGGLKANQPPAWTPQHLRPARPKWWWMLLWPMV